MMQPAYSPAQTEPPAVSVWAVRPTPLPMDEQLQVCIDLMQQQRFSAAMALLELVNVRFPHQVAILSDLGLCHAQLGHFELALVYLEQALTLDPGFIPAWRHRFGVHFQQGHYEKAVLCGESLLQNTCLTKKMYGYVLSDLGLCWIYLKDHERAAHFLERALQWFPHDPVTLSHKALLLAHQDKSIEAYIYTQFAVGNLGQNIRFMLTFVDYYRAQGEWAKIPPLLNLANHLAPTHPEVLYQTGKWIEIYEGNKSKAYPYLEQLYRLPHHGLKVETTIALAFYYHHLGRTDLALPYFYESYCLAPHRADLLSGYLLVLHASPVSTAADIFFWAQRYGAIHANPYTPNPGVFGNPLDGNRRLRIGYVSADFRQHSAVAAFLALLTRFNAAQFEVFAYANNVLTDEWGNILYQHVGPDHWREILAVDDDAVARMIQDDQIDILVDLSGHTRGNRLQVFARKPAPIQITGLGWGGTSGMAAMDYRISDPYISPPDTDVYNVEKILRISSLLQCVPSALYQQAEVMPIPSLQQGIITFGFGNSPFKLNAPLVACWADILKQVPNSKLHLKCVDMNQPLLIAHYTEALANLGIARDRLLFSGGTVLEEHLAFYQQVDIVLDAFPYNGGASTLDALWMGRPVVTLAGGTRAGTAIMNVLGHPEWVGQSPAEYVTIAVRLAQSPEHLQRLCQQLRSDLLRSALCQEQKRVAEIEAHYRAVWQQWCQEKVLG